jgi:hypothetical protein
MSAQQAHRTVAHLRSHIVLLVDNLPLTLAATKGRASSRYLISTYRELAALSHPRRSRFHARWLPSKLNPAGSPSRGGRGPSSLAAVLSRSGGGGADERPGDDAVERGLEFEALDRALADRPRRGGGTALGGVARRSERAVGRPSGGFPARRARPRGRARGGRRGSASVSAAAGFGGAGAASGGLGRAAWSWQRTGPTL